LGTTKTKIKPQSSSLFFSGVKVCIEKGAEKAQAQQMNLPRSDSK
jgi:hypothetical protein